MENFKNFMNFFGKTKKEIEKDPNIPSYIKSDGTKVFEKFSEFGKSVYEVSANGLLICRSYDKNDKMFFDYGRKANYEVAHSYDEDGMVLKEIDCLYNEHNVKVRNTEIDFEYYDNGIKSREFITVTPGDVKTEILYDESGNRKEKIVYQGSVKTWYDNNDKPVRREIDRGSGGIIKEDL